MIKRNNQSGVVLIISLILLLAITLIGVTGSNVTSLEERMSANSKDTNLAFQAAEAALRDAEAWLVSYPPAMTTMRTNATNSTAQGAGGLYTFLSPCTTTSPCTSQAAPQSPAPSPTNTTTPSDNINCITTSLNTVTLTAPTNAPAGAYCVNWAATGGNIRYGTYPIQTTTKAIVGVYQQPHYVIEELSSNAATGGGVVGRNQDAQNTSNSISVLYRITARGWGSNQNSIATVQSITKVIYPSSCC